MISFLSFAQNQNIEVNPLHTNEHCSSFEISIRDSVRLHFHENHTENLFVLKGKGKMYLGKKSFSIEAGDYVHIPKLTTHGVWVESDEPLKVISIQSPEFKGKDRHFVDEH